MTDIRAAQGDNFGAVYRTHHLAATCADIRGQQLAIKIDSLVAQWITFIDTDNCRHKAAQVFLARERWPGQGIARVKGFDTIGHGAVVGVEGAYSSYGPPWAQVAAAHLSGFKTPSTEGGLRVLFIIRYHEWVEAGQTDEFVFVTDLSATLIKIASVKYPGNRYKAMETIHYVGEEK